MTETSYYTYFILLTGYDPTHILLKIETLTVPSIEEAYLF